MDKFDITSIGFIVYFFLIITLGMVGFSPLATGFENVEPEYISGMLTALSILFGFWIVLVVVTPEEKIKNLRSDFDKRRVKFLYKYVTLKMFYVCFVSLFFSVICVYLTALEIIPSGLSLIVLFVIFAVNILYILIGLKALRIGTSD